MLVVPIIVMAHNFILLAGVAVVVSHCAVVGGLSERSTGQLCFTARRCKILLTTISHKTARVSGRPTNIVAASFAT